MSAPDPSVLQTKVLANVLLSSAAARASSLAGTFSVWLFAGFGAAFGLLVANSERFSYLPKPGRRAQVQGLFVLVQIGLLIAAACSVVRALAA